MAANTRARLIFQKVFKESIRVHSIVEATMETRSSAMGFVFDKAAEHLTADHYLILASSMLEARHRFSTSALLSIYGYDNVAELKSLHGRAVDSLLKATRSDSERMLNKSTFRFFGDISLGQYNFQKGHDHAVVHDWFGDNAFDKLSRYRVVEPYASPAQLYLFGSSMYDTDYESTYGELAEDIGADQADVLRFVHQAKKLSADLLRIQNVPDLDAYIEAHPADNVPLVVEILRDVATTHLDEEGAHYVIERHLTPVNDVRPFEQIAKIYGRPVGSARHYYSAAMKTLKAALASDEVGRPDLAEHPLLRTRHETAVAFDAPPVSEHQVKPDFMSREIYGLARYMFLPREFYMLCKMSLVKGEYAMTGPEMAADFDISPNTVKTAMTNKVRKVMKSLIAFDDHAHLSDHPYYKGEGQSLIPDWRADHAQSSAKFKKFLNVVEEGITEVMHPMQRYYYVQTHLRSAVHKVSPDILAAEQGVERSHVVELVKNAKQKLRTYIEGSAYAELISHPLFVREAFYIEAADVPRFAVPSDGMVEKRHCKHFEQANLLLGQNDFSVYVHQNLMENDESLSDSSLKFIFGSSLDKRSIHTIPEMINRAVSSMPMFKRVSEAPQLLCSRAVK